MVFLNSIIVAGTAFKEFVVSNFTIATYGAVRLGLSDGSVIELHSVNRIGNDCDIVGIVRDGSTLILATFSDIEMKLYSMINTKHLDNGVLLFDNGVMNVLKACKCGYISLNGGTEFKKLFAKYCMMG